MSIESERRSDEIRMTVAKLRSAHHVIDIFETAEAERCTDFKLIVDKINRHEWLWFVDFKIQSEDDRLSRLIITYSFDVITSKFAIGVLLNLIPPLKRSISNMNNYTLEALEIAEQYIRDNETAQTSPLPAHDTSGTSNPLDLQIVGQEWLFSSWRVMITSKFCAGRLFIVEHGDVNDHTYITEYKTQKIHNVRPAAYLRDQSHPDYNQDLGVKKAVPFDYGTRFRSLKDQFLADTTPETLEPYSEADTKFLTGVYATQPEPPVTTIHDLNESISRALGDTEARPLPEFLQAEEYTRQLIQPGEFDESRGKVNDYSFPISPLTKEDFAGEANYHDYGPDCVIPDSGE